jgi:hypothetical protein
LISWSSLFFVLLKNNPFPPGKSKGFLIFQ